VYVDESLTLIKTGDFSSFSGVNGPPTRLSPPIKDYGIVTDGELVSTKLKGLAPVKIPTDPIKMVSRFLTN